MSDDLISRKDVITIIENMIFEVGKDLSKSYLLQDAKERISQLNTAFNKEKVIEELCGLQRRAAKKQMFYDKIRDFENEYAYDMAQVCYENAIEIDEKGGIE